MKRLAMMAGTAVTLLCIAYFASALYSHWANFRDLSFGQRTLAGMAMALALYGSTYMCSAKSWQCVLRALDHPINYRAAVSVVAVSQLAKYLPGNVGHHFSRVLVARRVRLHPEITVTSVAIDTMLAVASAALCSFGAWHLWPDIAARYGATLTRNLVAAIVLGAALVVIFLVLRTTRSRASTLLLRCSAMFAPGRRAQALCAVASYLASFALGAAALTSIASGLQPAATLPWLDCLAIYAVAWLVGFLVPGAPAGLGVREALLVVGLAPLTGQDVATTTTALLRVVTVAGDGLAFLVGSALLPYSIEAPT